jgi:hypothetical protein
MRRCGRFSYNVRAATVRNRETSIFHQTLTEVTLRHQSKWERVSVRTAFAQQWAWFVARVQPDIPIVHRPFYTLSPGTCQILRWYVKAEWAGVDLALKLLSTTIHVNNSCATFLWKQLLLSLSLSVCVCVCVFVLPTLNQTHEQLIFTFSIPLCYL